MGRRLTIPLYQYLAYSVCRAIYNVSFHPLAKLPGPWLRSAFYFPHNFELVGGNIVHNWHELHEQYGEIVRMNPNWVSIINPDAWRGSVALDYLPSSISDVETSKIFTAMGMAGRFRRIRPCTTRSRAEIGQ